ncbi:CBS domain-containing protein [Roseimaritima ulvae]|uniref:Inosine-5'-monophosphate dehydrogenase n=1 Tax=Roseimaritima ulvae TaxID=980254 RepID=A0A5B9QQ61_9BACT|nr:CBS domain-containing protein [Roseimaritima ulvae]QEG39800.1 Inosine-5'-monophosphate dehydrogenase [Roseimaritima ulvae]
MTNTKSSQSSIYARRIKDVMSSDVVTLRVNDTVHSALVLMGENRVSALPVVDKQNRCVGILSTSDLVDMTRDVDDDLYHLDLVDPTSRRFLLDKLAHSMGAEPVQSFMSEAVNTVGADTTLGHAARLMLHNQVHHLPVIDDQEQLIGIISTMDVLAEFADAAPN